MYSKLSKIEKSDVQTNTFTHLASLKMWWWSLPIIHFICFYTNSVTSVYIKIHYKLLIVHFGQEFLCFHSSCHKLKVIITK